MDTRSIVDVKPHELSEYVQHHFFAGIGGWPYALRLAGWPDDKPVWTGSCPCQPLSCAGLGKGHADERHLWPAFYRLISECKPATVFGEQVASKDGREWLAGIRADLEGVGYAVGASDLCAAGVGSPHIRQRLYWVAHHPRERRDRRSGMQRTNGRRVTETSGVARGLVLPDGSGRNSRMRSSTPAGHGNTTEPTGGASGLDNPDCRRWENENKQLRDGDEKADDWKAIEPRIGSAWSDYDILPFRDNKVRRVEAGTFPLAHGIPHRVGLLRGYGNAIVPQLAKEFILASLESFS